MNDFMPVPSEQEWTESDRQWFERVRSLQSRVAQLEQDRLKLEGELTTARKVIANLQPRTFPMSCECCGGLMKSTADYDWHGVGNCVDICTLCEGSGYIQQAGPSVAACKFTPQHHLGPCPHCGADERSKP